jgi:hypothetical protein
MNKAELNKAEMITEPSPDQIMIILMRIVVKVLKNVFFGVLEQIKLLKILELSEIMLIFAANY